VLFPFSIVIDDKVTLKKAEPSMNRTLRGITIDWIRELKNHFRSIFFNCEGDSKEIDENDSQQEKHSEPRISIFCGITID
jgi:hypothetical protein